MVNPFTSHPAKIPVYPPLPAAVLMEMMSLAELLAEFASPPPEIVAAFVMVNGEFEATETMIVMGGKFVPGANVSERVQVRVARFVFQPVPEIAVAVRPVGSVATTVTVPELARFPRFVMLMVQVSAVSPWVKIPVWAK